MSFSSSSHSRKSFLFFIAILFSCAIALFSLSGASTHAVEIKEKHSEKKLATIASLTSSLISLQHLEKREFNDQLSADIFNNYLKSLDPGKMFFMKSEVEKFAEYGKHLNKLLPEGNIEFIFEMYNLMLRRVDTYSLYAVNMLDGGIDFTVDEEYEFDRSNADWPESADEMRTLWRKKVKNDILTLMLIDRSAKENEKDAKDDQAKEHSSWTKKTPEERIRRRLEDIVQSYNNLEPMEVLEIFLSALARVYDPHSAYMSPRTGKDFDITLSLSLVGIGAVLTSEDGYIKVVSIVPGGPADQEGSLKADDRIIAVAQDGKEPVDVIDVPLQKVVDQIRGELGTKVTLTVLDGRKGMQSAPAQITITRGKVEMKDSEAKGMIEEVTLPNGESKKIGVIKLPSFYMDFERARMGDPNFKSSTTDVKKILDDFNRQGVDGVIVDLRSNGGGSLYEAISLTGLFIPSGPVVQVKDKQNGLDVKEDADDGLIAYDGPLVVMVNRLSASASEIFAGAIKDYGRGIIVGDTKTHGKGTVQVLSELERYMPFFFSEKFPAGTLKLTNAKFYRINGESTQLKGVEPDIVFPSFTDNMDIGEDKLEHALPWDSIPSATYIKYNDSLETAIDPLKEKSEKRVLDSKDFQGLKLHIDTYNKLKERKTVSLNLEKRWQEYLDEKALQDEQTKLLGLSDSNTTVNDKAANPEIKDLYLNETMNIMTDYISMLNSENRLAAGQ